ncbi:MAG: NADH-quinone oxidoreductase subunit NuoI [Nitrospiraceae bacterium]|nr:NADH-quinone oxidoreductase subunit NuoI [Nitrospiraceae bacterium]
MTSGKILKTVFFVEILKGLALTFRTLFKHPVTRRYPKVKVPAKAGFRGLHALARNAEGRMKCVGCGLCGAYCPSKCIHIYTSEGDDHAKIVDRYEIDVLRCIFCGFCVEACPFGAITLSEHYEYSETSRGAFYMTREKLLENWDKYFAGPKGERYFKEFWLPQSNTYSSYEGQAMFRGRAKGKE